MKLEISITQDILNRSSMCNNDYGQNCAIGLAIADIFGKHSWVGNSIDGYINNIIYSIQIYKTDWNTASSDNDLLNTIELPLHAQVFIKEFDSATMEHRRKMTPFAFEIEIPDNVIEMVNIDEIYKVLENSTCLKLVEA